MSKKISFETKEEKVKAIEKEKAEHPNPTQYQQEHLADLEKAVIEN